MKAAQLTGYRKDFEIGEVPEPEITAPLDEGRMIGRGVLVPNAS